MGVPVEQGPGHLAVAKHLRPFAESDVGGDEQRGALVASGNQVEQELPATLGDRQIARFAEHHQIGTDLNSWQNIILFFSKNRLTLYPRGDIKIVRLTGQSVICGCGR